MSIITGKSTTKYNGEDTEISVRFRNKTPIEYFIFDRMFGAIQPEFIDDNDFDDFIDRAYQNACKSDLIGIRSVNDLTEEQIVKIKQNLDEWGGSIHVAGRNIGIQFPEENDDTYGILIDILFHIFNNMNRSVILIKDDGYYAVKIPKSGHYWIKGFHFKTEAVKFCEKHNLTIVEK